MKLLEIFTTLNILATPMNLDKMKDVGESAHKIMQVSNINHESALNIAYYLEKYETENIDSDLILSLIKTESSFNQKARNRYDGDSPSFGLGQIKYFWKKHYGVTGSLYDPETNIRLMYMILGDYKKKYGDLEVAISAYNRGEMKVNRDLKKGRNPTNKYSKKVLNLYDSFKDKK